MTETALPADYYTSATPVVADWGKVIAFTPEVYAAPETLDDLLAFVNSIANDASGKTLRFMGGLHSCSEIFESDIVVDTTRLPLTFDVASEPVDGANVVASANMHAHEFLARAAAVGLSLTATGGTDAQTLAGLVSTNTAGATAHHTIYESVAWIDYLVRSGAGQPFVSKRCRATDPDFTAIVCSLGVVGYITTIGFTLVPQRFFTAGLEVRPLADVLTDPMQTSAQYDFWRIEWLPDSNHGLFWYANPISGAGVDPDGDYPPDASEGLLKWVVGLDEDIFKSGPFLNEPLNLIYDAMALTYKASTAQGPMRHMIPVDRLAPLRVSQAEWGFDPEDLDRVMAVCRDYFGHNKWPNTPIEIELCKTDPYLMSPWNWPSLPCIVKFNFQYITDFLSDDEKAVMMAHLKGLWDALGAAQIRFTGHWGKINFLDADFVAANYMLDAFAPHIDPLFLNASMRARLIVPPA
jgi:hypothetical protein